MDIAIDLFSFIFGKIFYFLFELEIYPNVSIGTIMLLGFTLFFIVFVLFSSVHGGDN